MFILFTASTINDMKIKNRFVRSVKYEGIGTQDWRPTRRLEVLYSELAAAIGLIITSGAHFGRNNKLQKAYSGSFETAFD